MKKLPLALVISTAFAAPAAFADVDLGSGFAAYGTFHSAIESVQADTGSQTPITNPDKTQTRLADQRSVLGFKYKADIDTDLSAIAQVESRLYLGNSGKDLNKADSTSTEDSQAAALGDRNTFVGLVSKSKGAVRLGRYDNAYKLGIRLMASEFYANANEASKDYDQTRAVFGRMGARQGDMIAYESPNMAGFTVLASYNFGNDRAGGTDATTGTTPQLSAALGYAKGPLSLGLGYTKANNTKSQLSTNSSQVSLSNVDAAADASISSVSYGGQYKFGAFALGAVYETITSKNNAGTTFDESQDSFGVIGSYKTGSWEWQLRYAKANEVKGTSTVATGADQTSVVMGYDLGKKVKFVGSYTMLNNDRNARFRTGSGFVTAADTDLKILALGLSASF